MSASPPPNARGKLRNESRGPRGPRSLARTTETAPPIRAPMLKSRVIGTYTSTKPFDTEFYTIAENTWGFLQRSAPLLHPSATPENCPANSVLTYSSRRYLFNPPAVAGSPAPRPVLLHRVKNAATGMKGLIDPNSPTFTKADFPSDLAPNARGARAARGPRPNASANAAERPGAVFKKLLKDASGNFINAMSGRWSSNSFRNLSNNIMVSLGPLVIAAGSSGDAVNATHGQIVVTNPTGLAGPLTVTVTSIACKATSVIFLTQASGPGAALSAVASEGSFTVSVPEATSVNWVLTA